MSPERGEEGGTHKGGGAKRPPPILIGHSSRLFRGRALPIGCRRPLAARLLLHLRLSGAGRPRAVAAAGGEEEEEEEKGGRAAAEAEPTSAAGKDRAGHGRC